MDSPRYLALIGKSTLLARAELEAVGNLENFQVQPFNEPYCFEIIGQVDPQSLIAKLGGTVKIYQLLETDIATDLINSQQDHFCLSSLGHSDQLMSTAQQAKKQLKLADIKPHFRILDDPFYSANIISRYSEYCLLPYQGDTIIAKAVAVQDLGYWTKKDYGRPAFDPSSGMLPPKVGKMMINLALDQPKPVTTILDPMCGSGTILVEALDSGLKVIGSDISHKAVEASQANSAWFTSTFKPDSKFTVFNADATHLNLSHLKNQVDAIVFEGYLGPPHPVDSNINNLVKGLEKLYKGVFKNLLPLLRNQGKIVCALPEYHTRSGVKNLDHLVDWAATLGYTRLNRFTYGRKQSYTKRAIYVLQKN